MESKNESYSEEDIELTKEVNLIKLSKPKVIEKITEIIIYDIDKLIIQIKNKKYYEMTYGEIE